MKQYFALLLPAAMLCAAALFSGCDSARISEQHYDITEGKWYEDSVARFPFRIEDPAQAADISYNVRSTDKYPYYNLYVTYYLEDSAGRLLSSRLHDIRLADPVTGEPYGEGIGDIYDLKVRAIQNVKFPYKGNYTLKVKQYMRENPLAGIEAIGIRVAKAGEE
ncbi:MAG: gliding motility lipoprotein GldH [Bacteroidota bacterium]